MCAGNIDVFMAAHIKEDDSIKVAHFYRVPERSIADKLLSVFTGYRHRNIKPVMRYLDKDHDYDYCVFNNSNVSSGIIERTESYGIKAITIHHNYEVEFFRDNMPLAARLLYLHHVRKRKEMRTSEAIITSSLRSRILRHSVGNMVMIMVLHIYSVHLNIKT